MTEANTPEPEAPKGAARGMAEAQRRGWTPKASAQTQTPAKAEGATGGRAAGLSEAQRRGWRTQ